MKYAAVPETGIKSLRVKGIVVAAAARIGLGQAADIVTKSQPGDTGDVD